MKRNHTLHQEGEMRGSEHQQVMYSQSSQQNSYKNSIKCSPEREEGKKKVITLDIAELRQKIDSAHEKRNTTPIQGKERVNRK